ncbi:MAG: 4-hydroxy-tetrahydrodipicolinate synthase [Syntrophomonadaceae bacterium]|nr:4-hydroxy-tetrahydrodipicolinate synthase [Syntrophomonadaceae bacterium]
MGFPRLMTAMISPFGSNMAIDYDRASELANFLVGNGSQGIVVSGTTGEAPTLNAEEKLQLFYHVKQAVGDRAQVWAGVGTNSTASTVEMAAKIENLKLDGVMAVTPYYNKPSQEGLYNHFKQVALATSLPVMLYNVPGRTGVNLLPSTVARLAQIENVVALKEASGSMDQMSELVNKTPRDFLIYCGDDSLTLPMMALGAHGVVSIASHIIGNEIKMMIDAFMAGDNSGAARIHARLFAIFKLLFITTNPVPLKESLRQMGRDSGLLRGPLCPPSEEESREITKGLQEFGLL